MFSIEELEQMKKYTVLDFVYKIDEIMNKLEPMSEKAMQGKVESSRKTRTYFNEIKFICNVARDKISIDQGGERIKNYIQDRIDNEKYKIERAIARFEERKDELRKNREDGKEEEGGS